jgi:hypothetical protein
MLISKNAKNKSSSEQIKSVNLLKNIYQDIEEYNVNIDIILSNIKKHRSTYGLQKIGQFSEIDLELVDRMLKTFHETFRENYKKDIELDIETDTKKENLFASTFPKFNSRILNIKTKIQQLTKTGESDSDINVEINNLSNVYKEIFGNDNGNDNLNLEYIKQAIEANEKLTDNDLPNSLNTQQTSTKMNKLPHIMLVFCLYNACICLYGM